MESAIKLNETVVREWLRVPDVPRQYGLKREHINGLSDIIKKWNGIDEYASLFSLSQRAYHKYDVIALDIDGNTSQESFEKYQIIKNKLHHLITRSYFSGRGFWVFIDLDEDINTKEIYKMVCRQIVSDYGLEKMVDGHIVGDISRMARIPSSKNGKSGLFMVRLRGDESLEEILDKSKNNISYMGEVKKVHVKVDFTVEERNYERGIINPVMWQGAYPSCIYNAETILEEIGELKHTNRLHLASFLLWIDKEDELWKYIKQANDYRFDITKYQIEYLKNNGLKPYGCDKIVVEICPFKDKHECPFYPSINKTLTTFAEGGN